MQKLSLAALAVSIARAGVANAQIANRFKQEAEKALKDRLGDRSQDADKQQAGDESRSRPAARKDANREYPPGLSFSSVLNGCHFLAKNGKFTLNHIQATFLPDDCQEGWTVLRTADGKELYQFDWKPERLSTPYSLLNVHQTTDLQSGETLPAGIPLGTPGDYVLDFYLPTEHFYTLPFAVIKLGSGEAFGPGECYSLNGDWQNWGYLYYREAKPDQSLQWKVWLRNEGCEEESVKVRVEITRDADGDLVCTSRENTTYSVQPQWTRMEFDMVFPEGKEVPHGTYFKAQDLLGTDSAYTLTMKLNDQPYGTWHFAVEDGKLQYADRTLRGTADPLTFIEGGRDAWWYGKK
jgi:hypothetical protein